VQEEDRGYNRYKMPLLRLQDIPERETADCQKSESDLDATYNNVQETLQEHEAFCEEPQQPGAWGRVRSAGEKEYL
jgi:hypothetical protein